MEETAPPAIVMESASPAAVEEVAALVTEIPMVCTLLLYQIYIYRTDIYALFLHLTTNRIIIFL